jgi:hypothetical protein
MERELEMKLGRGYSIFKCGRNEITSYRPIFSMPYI